MSRHRHRTLTVRTIIMISVLFVVSSCSSTTLDSADSAVRSGLSLDQTALPMDLKYPASEICSYRYKASSLNGGNADEIRRITFKPVNDKILIVATGNDGKPSSALIGRSGKLYEFNSALAGKPDTRANTQTAEIVYKELVAEERERLKNHPFSGTNPHAINDFALEFPEYLPGRRMPGETAANVNAEDGSLWAIYQYVGISNYRGVRVAVFDLRSESSGEQRLIGFTLVDLRNAMPLYLAFSSGSSIRLEQISCS